MNLRLVRNRTFTSMLTLGIVGAMFAMGTRSASGQSITVTTPFPFCINNQSFPSGTYRFTPVSEWILSIRDVNNKSEELFPVRPEVRNREGSQAGPMWKVGGVTFRNSQGVHTLEAVYDPTSDVSFEFPIHNSREEHNCATKDYIARRGSAGK